MVFTVLYVNMFHNTEWLRPLGEILVNALERGRATDRVASTRPRSPRPVGAAEAGILGADAREGAAVPGRQEEHITHRRARLALRHARAADCPIGQTYRSRWVLA